MDSIEIQVRPHEYSSAAFHPLRPQVYISVSSTSSAPPSVEAFDALVGGRLGSARAPRGSAAVAQLHVASCRDDSEDGGLLVATLRDGRVMAWDAETLALLGASKTSSTTPAIAASAAREWIGATGADEQRRHWLVSCALGGPNIRLHELRWSHPIAASEASGATEAALRAAPRALVAGGGEDAGAPPPSGGYTALAWGTEGLVAAAWGGADGASTVRLWRVAGEAAALAPLTAAQLQSGAPIALLRLVTVTQCEVVAGDAAGASVQLLLAVDARGALSAWRVRLLPTGGASLQPLARRRGGDGDDAAPLRRRCVAIHPSLLVLGCRSSAQRIASCFARCVVGSDACAVDALAAAQLRAALGALEAVNGIVCHPTLDLTLIMRAQSCTVASVSATGDAPTVGRPARRQLGAFCGWSAPPRTEGEQSVIARRVVEFNAKRSASSAAATSILDARWEVRSYSLRTHQSATWTRLPPLSELSRQLSAKAALPGSVELSAVKVVAIERIEVASTGDAALLLLRNEAAASLSDDDANEQNVSTICGCVFVTAPPRSARGANAGSSSRAEAFKASDVHRCADAIFLTPHKEGQLVVALIGPSGKHVVQILYERSASSSSPTPKADADADDAALPKAESGVVECARWAFKAQRGALVGAALASRLFEAPAQGASSRVLFYAASRIREAQRVVSHYSALPSFSGGHGAEKSYARMMSSVKQWSQQTLVCSGGDNVSSIEGVSPLSMSKQGVAAPAFTFRRNERIVALHWQQPVESAETLLLAALCTNQRVILARWEDGHSAYAPGGPRISVAGFFTPLVEVSDPTGAVGARGAWLGAAFTTACDGAVSFILSACLQGGGVAMQERSILEPSAMHLGDGGALLSTFDNGAATRAMREIARQGAFQAPVLHQLCSLRRRYGGVRLLAIRPDRIVFMCLCSMQCRGGDPLHEDSATFLGGGGGCRAWAVLTRPLRAAEPLVLGLLSLAWPLDDLSKSESETILPPSTDMMRMEDAATLLSTAGVVSSFEGTAAAAWVQQIERTLDRHCAVHLTESYKIRKVNMQSDDGMPPVPTGSPRATNGLNAVALRALLSSSNPRVVALAAPLANPISEGANDMSLGHVERYFEEQSHLPPHLKAAAAAEAGTFAGRGGSLHASLAQKPGVQTYALDHVADVACTLPAADSALAASLAARQSESDVIASVLHKSVAQRAFEVGEFGIAMRALDVAGDDWSLAQFLGLLAAGGATASSSGNASAPRARIVSDATEALARLARSVVLEHDPQLRSAADLMLLSTEREVGDVDGVAAARAALMNAPLGLGETAARYDGSGKRRRDRLLETQDGEEEGGALAFESERWSWRDFFSETTRWGGAANSASKVETTAVAAAAAAAVEAAALLPSLLNDPVLGAEWMLATMRPVNVVVGAVTASVVRKCTVEFGRDASSMLAVAAYWRFEFKDSTTPPFTPQLDLSRFGAESKATLAPGVEFDSFPFCESMMGDCGLARALIASPGAAPVPIAPLPPMASEGGDEGTGRSETVTAAPALLHQGLAVHVEQLGPLDLGYFHRSANRVLSAFTFEAWLYVPPGSDAATSVIASRSDGYTKKGVGVNVLWEVWIAREAGAENARLFFGRKDDAANRVSTDNEETLMNGWQVRLFAYFACDR